MVSVLNLFFLFYSFLQRYYIGFSNAHLRLLLFFNEKFNLFFAFVISLLLYLRLLTSYKKIIAYS
ncbi:MAG: hypothetical protein COA40_07570 [Aequorivita sp.]|nr:MAG: hypothetical protein COA40_07570 [Aequorivita sp.]